MIRAIVLAVVATSLPATPFGDMVVGVPDRASPYSQKYVETLAAAVKTRFAAVIAASACLQDDNRYAYDLLAGTLEGGGRAILDRAASEGLAEGRSVAVDGADGCRVAIDRLRASDDRLIILAEHVTNG